MINEEIEKRILNGETFTEVITTWIESRSPLELYIYKAFYFDEADSRVFRRDDLPKNIESQITAETSSIKVKEGDGIKVVISKWKFKPQGNG